MDRPHYLRFLKDILDSFETQVIEALLGLNQIIVSEDLYDPSEEKDFPSAFPKEYLRVKIGSNVIVACAVLKGPNQRTLTDNKRGKQNVLPI
jgi:hypothetical protein